MKSSVSLSAEESLLFVDVLQNLLHVNKREHFFSWLQASLQSLIPHEVLICGFNEKNQLGLTFESFITTRYVTDRHVDLATKHADGFVSRAMTLWEVHHRPILISPEMSKDGTLYPLMFKEKLGKSDEVELRNIAAHGVINKAGEIVTFFSFSRIFGEPNAKHAHIIELLVPQMHQALLRTLNNRVNLTYKTADGNNEKPLISSREIEVLNWVYLGKTNLEIAKILSISVCTVKNHVHNAMKKLGGENRGQAASIAYRNGLIK